MNGKQLKEISFILLFLCTFCFGQYVGYESNDYLTYETQPTDTTAPDTFDTAPTIVFTAPNVDTIKVNPSEIDSSDIAYLRIQYATVQQATSSGTVNIPWATILSDSSYAIAHNITYNTTDHRSDSGYVFVDTTEIIWYRIGLVDDANNVAWMDTVRDTLTMNIPNAVPIDTCWVTYNHGTVDSRPDSAYFRYSPSAYVKANDWVDSTNVAMAVLVWTNANATSLSATKWFSHPDSAWNYASINPAYNSYLDTILIDSLRDDFQNFDNSWVFETGDTLLFTNLDYYTSTHNGKIVTFYKEVFPYDTLYFEDLIPPVLSTFTATGFPAIGDDSVQFSITGTFVTGDSIKIIDSGDSEVMAPIAAQDIDTTIFYDVSENTNETFRLVGYDTIPNYADTLSHDAEIHDDDSTLPTVSTFAIKLDTTVTKTNFNSLALAVGNSASGDCQGKEIQIKIGTSGDWVSLTSIADNTTTADTIGLWNYSYNIRDDSIFARARWYDEIPNSSAWVLDTIPKRTNFVNIVSSGGWSPRSLIQYVIVDFDTTATADDTARYDIGKIDTTLGGDSLKIIADTSLIGIRDTSYIAIKMANADSVSDYGTAYQFPQPGGGGGGSCETAVWTNTGTPTADLDINDNSVTVYVGQQIIPASDRDICKVEVYVSYKAGDISGKTFRAYFVPITGSDDFNTGSLVEADNTVTGSNGWAAAGGEGTAITFNWSTPYSMTASSEYGFVLTMDGASDASNYAEMEYTGDGNIPGGTVQTWDATGNSQGGAVGDVKTVFYTE